MRAHLPADGTWRHPLHRYGFLGVAVGYGALPRSRVVAHQVVDRVAHHGWRPCRPGGVETHARVADVLAAVDAGTLDRVCGCLTVALGPAGAPETVVDWAHELVCGDLPSPGGLPGPETVAERVHQLRHRRGRRVDDAGHTAFTDVVRAAALVEETALVGTHAYRRELVGAALDALCGWDTDAYPGLPAPTSSVVSAVGEAGADLGCRSAVAAAAAAVAAGPHMWYLADDDDHTPFGYRWATGFDPEHRPVAKAPVLLAPLLCRAIGERPLLVDAGHTAADVAWAHHQDPGCTDLGPLLAALAATRY